MADDDLFARACVVRQFLQSVLDPPLWPGVDSAVPNEDLVADDAVITLDVRELKARFPDQWLLASDPKAALKKYVDMKIAASAADKSTN